MATDASTSSSHRKIKRGSERSFGIVFAIIFAAIGFFPLVRHEPPRWWLVAIAGVLLLVAFAAPRILRPLNWVWFQIGRVLQVAVNPLIMAVLYYAAFVPIGLMLRAAGKDLLRLRPRPAGETYWIKREPPGPMTQQF